MSPRKKSTSNVVKGSPRKELFIDMLTRDISLIDAISDLIDNCVDGAIKLKGDKKFTGLRVDITVKDNCFKIKDNCGGIDKNLAQNYAFQFGRSPDTPPVDYSVGQFGIGMKRALFKMGKRFEIKSVSAKTSFTIEIDVHQWSKDKNWDFTFEKLVDKRTPLKKCGTEIIVSSLNPEIAERFSQRNFLSELREKLKIQHLMNISKGLEIRLNTHPIKSDQLKLLNSDKFSTAHWTKRFRLFGNTNVEVYAGIGEADLDKGGWYVFCNKRLIQGPEQTSATGWGTKSTVNIPKYHIQFSRFRGFVFFESRVPSFLPWNTSKTSIDTESPMYQNVNLHMTRLMRPVITFLNHVHNESAKYQNNRLEEKYLQKEIDSATLKNYSNVKTSSEFTAPTQKRLVKKTDETIIKYARAKKKIKQLKSFFKVSSSKEVGEKTFDYTYKRECK